MKFLCLCPVYNHRQELTENAVMQFLHQTYGDKHLVIMDDRPAANRLEPMHDWKQGISVFTSDTRFSTMGAKYNAMVKEATDAGIEWDAIAIWDDDDLYFPKHLLHHANVMLIGGSKWNHPSWVFSTYGQALRTEETGGRFWASSALTRQLYNDMGGFDECRQVSFDQQALGRMRKFGGDPGDAGNHYVYMWELTQGDHASGHSEGYACEKWYERVPVSRSTGPLVPRYTQEALWVLEEGKKQPTASFLGDW